MGVLLVYFYEPDQPAGLYARYGVMGLRHRGPRVSYAVLRGDGLEQGRLNPWSNGWSLPEGSAVLAAVEPTGSLAASRSAAVAVDGACSAAEALRLVEAAGSPREAAEALASSTRFDGCTVAALTRDGGYVLYRGRSGVRPLSLGGYGFDAVYAATETAPITLMGGEPRRDLEPGEAVYGDRYTLDTYSAGGGRRATSLFEYIYLARPDSLVDGVNVYLFRREMGRRLARSHPVEVDVVVGVPETALPYALGYAEEKQAPIELALVSTIGRVRTAIAQASLEERLMMLSLKFNPVPGVFEGRRVAVVDDSVVTGLTLKTFIHRLWRSQAPREVHVAVSSPKIVATCPHRVQLLEPGSLIARQLSDEAIERVLDVDSLAWLPLGEAVSYLRSHGIDPCTACMLEEVSRE